MIEGRERVPKQGTLGKEMSKWMCMRSLRLLSTTSSGFHATRWKSENSKTIRARMRRLLAMVTGGR